MSTYWLCCKCGNVEHRTGAGWYCTYYEQWVEGTNDGYGCPGWCDEDSGSSSSGSDGCFLTSACVKHLGKADDCMELQTLRAFRDNYMAKTEEGLWLIKRYYATAPQIVQKIESSNNSANYYNGIYQVICKCISLIKQNKLAETMQEYKQMVLSLQQQLCVD